MLQSRSPRYDDIQWGLKDPERDQVFIGNQREQLQEEPAQVPSCHINPVLLGGDAMRWALREYGTGVEMSSAIN